MGQRRRHQPRDRLRRRLLRHADDEEDDAAVAGPQRDGRQRRLGADARRPERPERLLRRQPGPDRAQPVGRVDQLDRRDRARVRPRRRRPHAGRHLPLWHAGVRRRHLRRLDRGVLQPEQSLRRAGLPGRRGDQPGRQRPDPQHVQPGREGAPELLLLLRPHHGGARGGRTRQPLVLPGGRGQQPGRRQAVQLDVRRLHGHGHRHPEGTADHVQRDADEDVGQLLPAVPDLDADRGEEPLLRLHRVQHDQGGVGRGGRAGAVR